MTIGPEPMTQTHSRSRLRRHQRLRSSSTQLLEDRPGVVRARAGLGVELHRARTQLREVEALDRPVVEGDVRGLVGVRGLDREAVVLARHEHPPAAPLEHRVVRAAVAERELERPVSGREPEQLVAEADAEDRDAAEQAARPPRTSSRSGSGSPGPFERTTPSKPASSSALGRVREDGDGGARRRRARRRIERFVP